jgi:hypothetical protein
MLLVILIKISIDLFTDDNGSRIYFAFAWLCRSQIDIGMIFTAIEDNLEILSTELQLQIEQ